MFSTSTEFTEHGSSLLASLTDKSQIAVWRQVILNVQYYLITAVACLRDSIKALFHLTNKNNDN